MGRETHLSAQTCGQVAFLRGGPKVLVGETGCYLDRYEGASRFAARAAPFGPLRRRSGRRARGPRSRRSSCAAPRRRLRREWPGRRPTSGCRPPDIRVTPALRRELNATLDRFVPAAVLREDPMEAYSLSTPTLRTSATRAQWKNGEIPRLPVPGQGGVQPARLASQLRREEQRERRPHAAGGQGGEAGQRDRLHGRLQAHRRALARRVLLPDRGVSPRSCCERVAHRGPADLAPQQRVDGATRTNEDVANRIFALAPLIIVLTGLGLVIGVFVTQFVRGKRAERDYLAGRL